MLKNVLKVIGAILLILVFVVVTFVGYLTVDEYKPADVETIEIEGKSAGLIELQKENTILSWNVGYGALGDNADFFMDGGKMVNTADKERVTQNLSDIADCIDSVNPDILFLQELDRNSTRSSFIDELTALDTGSTNVLDYQTAFAPNYKVAFVPLPVPPIGKVLAGLATASKYQIDVAERYALPCPFTWPLRTINLKRCLQVMRAPVSGSDKELVLINLHLDAYDSGEGKIMQTNMLKNLLQSEVEKGNYVIAGGDFNQIFSNTDTSAYPQLDVDWKPGAIDVTEFGDDFVFATDSSVPTCRSLDRILVSAENKDPEHFQYYMLDGYIVSSNVEIGEITTLDLGFKASDHNPVVMKFTLN